MPGFISRAAFAAVIVFAGLWATAARAEAPAFSAKDLTALPRTNWVTNGGNIFNQRYSPLDQINRDNVAGMKALWTTHMGSGAAPNNDGEEQILAYKGVLYTSNGANDVFAIDIETGKILWTYHGNPAPEAGVGKTSRGLAMGDGKVYLARLDAIIDAIDMKTGKKVWSTVAEDWRDGFSITSAPLYYDGLVITGFSGGELGIRGRVKAFDAKTGKLVWNFYTVPGPGELGHDTWPADSDAWKQGGAPVWQTPAVDPELGMIYFSTGNPSPDLAGYKRPGDNLFSDSIVALDVHTGEYKWHFQQVHHDLWDFDSPNPVILFDAMYKGKMRKALVEVGKTGWAYILDRETGEPLIGIEEKPVMQEPRQFTSPTQPHPIGDAVVPQKVDIRPEGARLTPDGTTVINEGRIFTPFWTDSIVTVPGSMGGANWPPSSYDPQTNLLYVCATDRITTYNVDDDVDEHKPGGIYMGGMFGQAKAEDRGIFAALDMGTNRLVWRQQWRDICYSGSVVTAGGLVFVGRNDGRLTALDKANGNQLWEFLTDAGLNTTVTTVEWKDKQYVVVHAGGATFAGSKKGDTIWAFSLDGKIDSVKPVATNRRPGGGLRLGVPQQAANLENGAAIFQTACSRCHGPDGNSGSSGGPTLIKGTTFETMMQVTTDGRNDMPSFRDLYSQNDLKDVSRYILDVLAKAK